MTTTARSPRPPFRRLWDEVCAAHAWWVEQGRPDEPDWLFTVHPDQQTIELASQRRTDLHPERDQVVKLR
ncbi:MAG: hypothetical protein ACT4NY_13065 [Pseudonocardiales bacterium]